jgi:hypothetical protein
MPDALAGLFETPGLISKTKRGKQAQTRHKAGDIA